MDRRRAEMTPGAPGLLGRYIGSSPCFWRNLQSAYELALADREIGAVDRQGGEAGARGDLGPRMLPAADGLDLVEPALPELSDWRA